MITRSNNALVKCFARPKLRRAKFLGPSRIPQRYMKRLSPAFFILLLMTVLIGAGCGSTSVQTDPELSTSPPPDPPVSEDIPIERVAVCVYETVGLREEPGNHSRTKDGKNNYLVGVRYGEKVEVFVDSPTVEAGPRTYMKVRLLDGQEGWVHDYVFEKNGRLAVMTQATSLYRRPDPMTLRDEKLLAGEIVVVVDDLTNPSNGSEWLQVTGRNKEKKGWMRRQNNHSYSRADIQVALLYYKARLERDPERRLNRLIDINSTEPAESSVLTSLVEQEIKALEGEVDPELLAQTMASTQSRSKLFITESETWLYDDPQEEQPSGNGLRKLKHGDICDIIERGERRSINDMNDYWYHVRYEDVEGWVYGFYTSERVIE